MILPLVSRHHDLKEEGWSSQHGLIVKCFGSSGSDTKLMIVIFDLPGRVELPDVKDGARKVKKRGHDTR